MPEPEDRWAERFARDVDAILGDRDRDDEVPPADYGLDLDLAKRLSDLDVADESRARGALRRRLLAQAARRGERRLHVRLPSAWTRLGALALAWMGLCLGLLMTVSLARPGILTITTRRAEDAVHRAVRQQPLGVQIVAAETVAPEKSLQVRRPAPNQVVVVRKDVAPVTFVTGGDRMWFIDTPIGSLSGSVLPNVDEQVWHMHSLDEVQRRVHFALRQPGYLPDGYALREAAVSPLLSAHLTYSGPSAEIVLVQMRTDNPGDPLVGNGRPLSIAWTTVTDKVVERSEVNQRPASWIEGHGLLWEDDEMSFLVGGKALTLDEARRIARSLR